MRASRRAERLLRARSALAVGGERRVHRRAEGEHLGERGDAEDLEQPLGVDDELQPPVEPSHALEHADEEPEPGGVHEAHLGEVHDQVHVPGVDQAGELLAQRGRGVHVDLAGHVDDGPALDGPAGHADVHRSSPLPSGSIQTDRAPPAHVFGAHACPAGPSDRVNVTASPGRSCAARARDRGSTTATTGYPPVTGWSAPNTTGRPSGGTWTAPGTRGSEGSSPRSTRSTGGPSRRSATRSLAGVTA